MIENRNGCTNTNFLIYFKTMLRVSSWDVASSLPVFVLYSRTKLYAVAKIKLFFEFQSLWSNLKTDLDVVKLKQKHNVVWIILEVLDANDYYKSNLILIIAFYWFYSNNLCIFVMILERIIWNRSKYLLIRQLLRWITLMY